ncbi:hypothetical protein SAMN04489761_3488 [Tenacibaculum sp. MAR_2009_124]|nr:hypothetical protein SAMN04489761_3371 [Tenacibaculum sp. MAR_2009_124]SEC68177.1 hypothetical protein SAMN04489761_3488 [Tenacibaculum sp. MAR_2009_124]
MQFTLSIQNHQTKQEVFNTLIFFDSVTELIEKLNFSKSYRNSKGNFSLKISSENKTHIIIYCNNISKTNELKNKIMNIVIEKMQNYQEN